MPRLSIPWRQMRCPFHPPSIKFGRSQGIRLMRKFAGSLAYQRLPGGNRLTIGFALPR